MYSDIQFKPPVTQLWHSDVSSLLTPIPMIGVPSWGRAAARCGFSVEAAFREAGVELGMNPPQGGMVTADALLRAVEVCVKRSTEHHFPLALGEAYVFDRFPQVEAFMATSATLREAIEALPWIRAMQLPWLWLNLEETEDQAALVVTLDPEMARRAEAPFVVEIVLAACRKFAKALLGRSLAQFAPPIHLVQFQKSRPDNAAVFQDFFPCQVQFGAPRNALVFPKGMLDIPLEGALSSVHGQARRAIELELAASQPRFASTESVRQALDAQADLLKGGLEEVAEAMGIHARTLQRRLQSEGFKFADLLAQAKYARARQMLSRKAISMEIISVELGFSDRRAFTYAFKRWSGMSPSAYRTQVLQTSMTPLRHP
ncbi:MAG: AraC family transcriptional regulator [Rubrivivax sp.]|nr:MAG: AraC family transcriptional regulator [Rubrivivax sp.]